MCYAIPGRIIEIDNSIVTVDYFGQTKKARNDFYENLRIGDYIYAQGGFVVKRIPQGEAVDILDTWRELFIKLEEVDLRLARQPKDLYQIANSTRQQHLGNSCCIHGIIEFSNYCRNDCLYCGIRKNNTKLSRYRMGVDEIVEACIYAIKELNFKALVLQSGEDIWYDEEKLVEIVSKIMKENPVLLILSIGERELGIYKRLYQAGARGVLLRFETSNPVLFGKYKPGKKLQDRLDLIRRLHDIGYLIFTGFLIGLPGQTEEDILNDIELTGSLRPEMFSFGPFIPPQGDIPKPSLELVLSTIARARIRYPDSRILVTTALETLDNGDGARLGLLSGGNSMMINVTPEEYQRLYEIYPNRAGTGIDIKERIDKVVELLHSIGRAPTDLGISL